MLRFLAAAPLGLLIPSLQRWLAIHASSLTMNFAYRRDVTRDILAKIRRDSRQPPHFPSENVGGKTFTFLPLARSSSGSSL